jgi:hypothetical protein
MSLIGSTVVSTDTLSQLFGRKPPIRLDHVAFAMDPFRLNRVKPGALRWQQEGQDTHTYARLRDLLVVLANPGANNLTLVPRSIIPNQKPVGLAVLEQTLAAPIQKLRGDCAHWTPGDKTQPHLLTFGFLWGPFLPEHAITGQRFGIRISFLEGLFDEADRMLRVLPGVQARQGKATPPHLILKADGEGEAAGWPRQSTGHVRFFLDVLWVGTRDPVFGTLPVGFQSLESATHAFVGDLRGNDALLVADLGCSF